MASEKSESPAEAVAAAPAPVAPTPSRLFWTFAFISAVTVGGGYAIVPVIGNKLEKRGWVSEDEFHRLFAKAQSFPGPFALTTALLCGKNLAGVPGAAAAAAGMVLPPFGALIVVGAVLGKIGDLQPVRDFLAGAGATVPGLIAAMIWKMSKKRAWTVPRVASAIALTALLAVFPALTLPLFFSGIALMYVMERAWRS
ncbi:MAG: chromate transporter [Spirochaetaceae bacterium]|nr:chromate transporter [Spirochaetaceae bacterium]